MKYQNVLEKTLILTNTTAVQYMQWHRNVMVESAQAEQTENALLVNIAIKLSSAR